MMKQIKNNYFAHNVNQCFWDLNQTKALIWSFPGLLKFGCKVLVEVIARKRKRWYQIFTSTFSRDYFNQDKLYLILKY